MISNKNEVLQLVKKHSRSTCILSFGIGAGADNNLVIGLAKNCCGSSVFIDNNTRIEKVEIQQLKRALQPIVKEVSVNWGSVTVEQTPNEFPTIFSGDRLIIYGLDIKGSLPPTIELNLHTTSGTFSHQVSLPRPSSKGITVHRAAAASKINELEKLSDQQQAIIQYGKKYNLISQHTSLICVETRTEPVSGTMKTADITDVEKIICDREADIAQIEKRFIIIK